MCSRFDRSLLERERHTSGRFERCLTNLDNLAHFQDVLVSCALLARRLTLCPDSYPPPFQLPEPSPCRRASQVTAASRRPRSRRTAPVPRRTPRSSGLRPRPRLRPALRAHRTSSPPVARSCGRSAVGVWTPASSVRHPQWHVDCTLDKEHLRWN